MNDGRAGGADVTGSETTTSERASQQKWYYPYVTWCGRCRSVGPQHTHISPTAKFYPADPRVAEALLREARQKVAEFRAANAARPADDPAWSLTASRARRAAEAADDAARAYADAIAPSGTSRWIRAFKEAWE